MAWPVSDDSAMSNQLVSKLYEVDPVFAEVIDMVYGGTVDPREAWDTVAKFEPSPSDLHVNSNNWSTAKKHKKQAQVGLASNIVGIAAGDVALGTAGKKLYDIGRAKEVSGQVGPVSRRLISSKSFKFATRHPKGTALAGAGLATGLQAANVAGDLVANRVLDREARKKIKKSIDEVMTARRLGVITTDQALDMVEKALQQPIPVTAKKPQQLATNPNTLNQKIKLTPMKPQKPQLPAVPNVAKASPELTWEGEISKTDTDKRQVFGWASVTHVNGEPVVDRQGDYIPMEEIEKAAYSYVLSSRKGGDMHKRAKDAYGRDVPLHTSDLIESVIMTPEKVEKMGGDPKMFPQYGWWVGFKVNDDEQWNLVKSGERTGFSIHGRGTRVSKEI